MRVKKFRKIVFKRSKTHNLILRTKILINLTINPTLRVRTNTIRNTKRKFSIQIQISPMAFVLDEVYRIVKRHEIGS